MQVTYFDEYGVDSEERLRLHTPAQQRIFALSFLPLHMRAAGITFTWCGAADIEAAADRLRALDIV